MTAHSDNEKAWNALEEYLADSEGLSRDEVVSDLRREGVDTDTFLARIRETSRKGLQKVWRSMAEEERKADEARAEEAKRKVSDMSLVEVKSIFADAQGGMLGQAGQEIALAARNQSGEDLDEEELRSCVADILSLRNDE